MNNDQDNIDKELELDHEYDGIKELNHPLPGWWKATFYGGIIYAIFHFIYFNFGPGESLKTEYVKELAVHVQTKEMYLEKLSEFNEEKFNNYFESEEMVSYGKEVYTQNCQSCHNVQGAGDIGPNLSDKHWLYSEGTPETFYPFIIAGIPSAGMPAWGPQLSEDDLYAVTAYVMSFQGIEHSDTTPKAPQGDEYPHYQHQKRESEEVEN